MVLSYTHIFCPTGGTQSGAPNISNVLVQVKEEETEAGCWRYGLTDRGGLLVIWDTAVGSYLVQVLGTKFVVLQRQLDGSGIEPTVGTGKVVTTGEVLWREGANRRTSRRFCVAVVQEVLIFETETWVMTLQLEKSLEGTSRPLANPDKADCMFAELRGDIPKTPQQERHR